MKTLFASILVGLISSGKYSFKENYFYTNIRAVIVFNTTSLEIRNGLLFNRVPFTFCVKRKWLIYLWIRVFLYS